jgi:hypothetical protein
MDPFRMRGCLSSAYIFLISLPSLLTLPVGVYVCNLASTSIIDFLPLLPLRMTGSTVGVAESAVAEVTVAGVEEGRARPGKPHVNGYDDFSAFFWWPR